jgi:hypothetical protein
MEYWKKKRKKARKSFLNRIKNGTHFRVGLKKADLSGMTFIIAEKMESALSKLFLENSILPFS